MDAQEQENKRDKVGEDDKLIQEDPPTKLQSSTTPSPASSPSREFSFTISLHPSSAGSNTSNSFAIDLSPADEIFFHGHLLPLHLISHIPLSRSSSKNSLDSFSLLVKDISEGHHHNEENTQNITSIRNAVGKTKGRTKMKLLPSFWFAKRRKGSEASEQREDNKKLNKAKFDLLQLFKRYLRMVKPKRQLRARGFSFSDIICSKEKQQLQGRRGGLSAPATMQTSPRNSGNVTPDILFPSKGDGSMEELHSAIQAAIAHCKNSTSVM